MPTVLQDLRYAVRLLVKSPGFTVIAVAVLALGIGVNTAIFSVVNAVLLRPLPYAHSDRLVWITQNIRELHAEIAAGADYLDWQEQNHTFEKMTAYEERGSFNLSGRGTPERVDGALVSASFFQTLGVHPRLGRAFSR